MPARNADGRGPAAHDDERGWRISAVHATHAARPGLEGAPDPALPEPVSAAGAGAQRPRPPAVPRLHLTAALSQLGIAGRTVGAPRGPPGALRRTVDRHVSREAGWVNVPC